MHDQGGLFLTEPIVGKRVRRVWLDRAEANMPLLNGPYWVKGVLTPLTRGAAMGFCSKCAVMQPSPGGRQPGQGGF